jgi:prephenate dehydrogenase
MIVTIAGLGLMGGSFALALKEKGLASKVFGYDSNAENARAALELGLVDALIDESALGEGELIVLAVPVEASVAILDRISLSTENATIIDLGSTKEKIISHCPKKIRKNFVACHPMTGTEYNGPKAAFKELYEGKTVVLCDTQQNLNVNLETAKKIFETLNMSIVFMDSATHDSHAALISHLPHLISFSLANSVLGREDTESILTLAAGGFKDMSRLAKSSPAMWKDIFVQNKQNILKSLEIFKDELGRLENAIKMDDEDALTGLMQNANNLHRIFK